MGNGKKILKSEFPSELHKSAIPLITWNLGSKIVFFGDVSHFNENCNISISDSDKI
jgi:hypothetical protein